MLKAEILGDRFWTKIVCSLFFLNLQYGVKTVFYLKYVDSGTQFDNKQQ